jgi:uncharacterized integral membrane protein
MTDEMGNEATRELLRIAVFEAALIGCVIAVYLATQNIAYLIGGIVGAQIIVAPMFLRWISDRRQSRTMREGSEQK